MLPRGTNIKRNDLVRWWCGSGLFRTHLDPIKDDGEESVFEKDLSVLLEMKVIEPAVMAGLESVRKNNKRDGVKYRMLYVIWSKFHDSEDACNLTTERLNIVSKQEIMMMQLGSWNHNPSKYIVVEDVESLSKVLSMYRGHFLSLEGVSGLVQLPSIKGIYFKVLNLKGCHNLESLPRFKAMNVKNLEYLDMSECYQLDHPTNALTGCTELRVLKGFILSHRPPEPHISFISNPSQVKHLWKLTLRTRCLNFPTNSNLDTLCDLQSLTHLKITRVGACSSDDNQDIQFDASSKFPPKLTKFEMEAASESTSTKILDLIAQQKMTNTSILHKKLYIKGGNLSKLNPEVDCKILRLQYLPNMQLDCYDMMRSFPKLHRLEMSKDVMYSMLRQSFETATVSKDRDSGWKPSLTPHDAFSSS